MIQLNSRKKIIIFTIVILAISVSVIVLVLKNRKDISQPPIVNNKENVVQVRDMTRDEKIDVGISPDQEAEVVNDQGGLFIYRLKK